MTRGEDSTGPPVLKVHSLLPLAKSKPYTLPSCEPMKTRPSSMAADDLTGPPVLKLQTKFNFSGKLPLATPSSAGPPRNIGQPAAGASICDSPRNRQK